MKIDTSILKTVGNIQKVLVYQEKGATTKIKIKVLIESRNLKSNQPKLIKKGRNLDQKSRKTPLKKSSSERDKKGYRGQ